MTFLHNTGKGLVHVLRLQVCHAAGICKYSLLVFSGFYRCLANDSSVEPTGMVWHKEPGVSHKKNPRLNNQPGIFYY